MFLALRMTRTSRPGRLEGVVFVVWYGDGIDVFWSLRLCWIMVILEREGIPILRGQDCFMWLFGLINVELYCLGGLGQNFGA